MRDIKFTLLTSYVFTILGADTTNEMTVLQTEPEVFVLDPVEIVQKGKRSRRKRKLIVDEEKILSTDSIKAQLSDTTDIVKHATLAPPSKRRMTLKTISTVEQLFSLPCLDLLANPIVDTFVVNLTKTIKDAQKESDEKMETNEVEEETSQESFEAVEKNKKNVSVTFEEPLPPVEDPPMDIPEEMMMTTNFEPEVEEKENEKEEPEIPSSQIDEEQKMNSETEEQFENRRWTKRTNQLLHTLKREFKQKDTVNFNKLVQKNSRKQAAYKFYSCLLLSKDNTLAMTQDDLFGNIMVRPGNHFAAAC